MFAFQAATLERLRLLKLMMYMSDLLQNYLAEMRKNAELKLGRNQVRALENQILSLHAMPQSVYTSPSPSQVDETKSRSSDPGARRGTTQDLRPPSRHTALAAFRI
jgi:hypothetical protein